LSRISDADVRENLRATFVPLILKRTTIKEERKAAARASRFLCGSLFK